MRCIALTLAVVTGCSFVIVDGPPKSPHNRPVCTTSKGLPVIDAIIGTADLAMAVTYETVANLDSIDSDISTQLHVFAIVSAIGAAGFYASALSGNSKVNRCREAQARWDAGK